MAKFCPHCGQQVVVASRPAVPPPAAAPVPPAAPSALAILAVVFFIVGIVVQPRWAFVVGLILAIIFTAIFVIDMFDILGTSGLGVGNVGFGMFLGVAGGVIAAVGAIMGIAARRV